MRLLNQDQSTSMMFRVGRNMGLAEIFGLLMLLMMVVFSIAMVLMKDEEDQDEY